MRSPKNGRKEKLMSCVTWHLLLLGRAQPLCVCMEKKTKFGCLLRHWLFPQHPALQKVKGNMKTFSSLYLHSGVHVFLLTHTQAVTFNIYVLWEENWIPKRNVSRHVKLESFPKPSLSIIHIHLLEFCCGNSFQMCNIYTRCQCIMYRWRYSLIKQCIKS